MILPPIIEVERPNTGDVHALPRAKPKYMPGLNKSEQKRLDEMDLHLTQPPQKVVVTLSPPSLMPLMPTFNAVATKQARTSENKQSKPIKIKRGQARSSEIKRDQAPY